MKVCFPVLLIAILVDSAVAQRHTIQWNRAQFPGLGCGRGFKCASFRRCYQLVVQAAHQYGTITASALRLHFSHRSDHFSPVKVQARLSRDRCPGRERTCCPALYSVITQDLLDETRPAQILATPKSDDLDAAESNIALRTTHVPPKTTTDSTAQSAQWKKRRLKNRAVLEQQCKTPLHNRVFLGHEVKAGQLPWIAMLQYKEKGQLRFSCGGTLISDRYILTAAHCAKSKRMMLVSARLGEVNLNSDCDDVAEQDYLNNVDSIFGDLLRDKNVTDKPTKPCSADPQDMAVEQVVVHPGYKFSLVDGFPNDLALVRLKERVQPTQFVHPICLRGLAKKLTPKEEAAGMLTVAGWGMTNMEDGPKSENLRQATVKCVSRNVCRTQHKLIVRDKCQKCAGGLSGNACMGDSGGPLALQVQGKMSYLVGVVSFGSYECGALATPTVFSDLTCYIDWILDTIQP